MRLTVQQMLYYWVFDCHRFGDRGLRDFPLPVQNVLDAVRQRWIQKEFKPLKLHQMVELSGASRSTFIRIFKEATGQNPSHFFEHQRLYLAREHLLETDITIDQIANQLHYSS